MELQNSLMLVKADLRRKAETLAQTQSIQPLLPPPGSDPSATPGSCKKRGCGAAAPNDTENRPPSKRPLFPSLFPTRTPTRKYNSRAAEEANITPYSRILRSRQQSPPCSPAPTSRYLRGKYWALRTIMGVCAFWYCAKLDYIGWQLYIFCIYSPCAVVSVLSCQI